MDPLSGKKKRERGRGLGRREEGRKGGRKKGREEGREGGGGGRREGGREGREGGHLGTQIFYIQLPRAYGPSKESPDIDNHLPVWSDLY